VDTRYELQRWKKTWMKPSRTLSNSGIRPVLAQPTGSYGGRNTWAHHARPAQLTYIGPTVMKMKTQQRCSHACLRIDGRFDQVGYDSR
jgi:hypothetical protein